jgi:transcriptional regulator of nitric oxide reductase
VRVPPVPALLLTTLLAVGAGVTLAGQAPADQLEKRLRTLFPEAATFGAKGGSPPHYKAFAASSGSAAPAVMGYAFWTTDLEPLEGGYDGPIQMLVGISPRGVLAGIVVGSHREPYGYFSVDPPEFAAQFKNKDVRDPFKVGSDVQAISRATITIASATRAIRNSSRRFARQMLTPPTAAPPVSTDPAR